MRPLFALLLATAFLSPMQAQTTCGWNPDSNGDYFVTVTDLLALLSVFEEADTDMDGIFDSQDDCVGSYDACGVCNGTGVDADSDGVCDDVDPCVGALDACGLCNGPGPTVPVIDEIVFMTDSVYLPPLQQWYVFTYAVDTLYTYVCPVQGCMDANAYNFNPAANIDNGSCTFGPAQCSGLSTVTFDGHTYALVGIGTQCWFAENLRSENYRNGDAIPGDLNNLQWTSTGSGAHAVYNNDPGSLATYGRLYNWYAVSDSRGLCPSGFHVPSDGEWMTLEMALGMTSSQANSTGWRGTDQGTQMKTPSWGGTNSSGFSALPGGFRVGGFGYFDGQGSYGNWWSSSPNGPSAWARYLNSGYSDVYRASNDIRPGLSVRCVRD
jgi:uncharacterized protein (TIGR02145 family)